MPDGSAAALGPPRPGGRATAFFVPAWASEAARWALVLVFAATALAKLLDNRGFAAALAGYRLFPEAVLLPLGLTVSLAELAVALGLARAATARPAALAALALALANAAVLWLTLLRGIALANCGCFGAFLGRPLTPWTPLEDLALAALACCVLLGGRRREAVRSPPRTPP